MLMHHYTPYLIAGYSLGALFLLGYGLKARRRMRRVLKQIQPNTKKP